MQLTDGVAGLPGVVQGCAWCCAGMCGAGAPVDSEEQHHMGLSSAGTAVVETVGQHHRA